MQSCAIGERLREERERFGWNQEELGQRGGVNRNTQGKYEKGERNPDSSYLTAVSSAGVDVLYVLTGQRAPVPVDGLSNDAYELVQLYQQISEADRSVLLRMAWAFAKANAQP
ncbi:helix-turn-helix domain-containing protein [Pseudomonas fulva]|uniref:helix-turn-helix domain-containing protein n=1 Tax=Pseudomonas fulva TaxID=47880 RepID=UPI0021ABF62F|nr:helix-turn-helix domain-containing protein [Pseudomonas fulva]